uniref:Uncharacterized protein n=1 Tax=Zea mays TaxID=4577 RepID=B6SYU4_MAIZE|nr:hypothetical protein [Zea mays]
MLFCFGGRASHVLLLVPDLEKFLSRRRRSVRSGSEATMAGGGGISWSAVLLQLDG